MKITKVKIENFKSIQELELDFQELTAILWPNSVWKSNVLKAIDLVLWERWTTKWSVKKELFYNPEQELKIEIYFDTPIKYFYYWKEKNIKCASVVMSCNWNSFTCDSRLWEEWYNDGISWSQYNKDWYYLNDDFKKSCSFIYIPSIRDLEDQMRVSNWTMLWKMMQRIFEDYSDNYWTDIISWEINRKEWEIKLKQEFKEKMEEPKEFLEKDFEWWLNFAKFKKTFIKNCENNSLWLANKFTPELDIYDINWFYKTLQINISEDWNNEKIFNAQDVGSWMQNLLLLAIFQTYAELMAGTVIFGIEEPELFLYPNAQRALYNTFVKLSSNTQILYTTHNPIFLDASKPNNIIMLRKDKDWTQEIEKQNISSFSIEEEMKIYTHFNYERNEIFLSKRVVLVEWPSEKIILNKLCEERWIDVNSLWVSIIECWWKTGVLYFIGVCRLSWIDYIAVWDKDEEKKNGEVDDKYHNFWNSISEWRWIEMEDDLELEIKTCGYSDYFTSKNKILNAYNWIISDKEYWVPEKIEQILEFIKDEWEENQDINENPIPIKVNNDNEISIEDIPF